jgi:phosphatidylglycerophosphatase A
MNYRQDINTLANQVTFKALLKRPLCFLAYGLGSGLAPKAPGTFGTLAAVPIYLLLTQLSQPLYFALVIISFIAGIWFCQAAVDWLNQEDPSAVVWDEFVGYWVTMLFAPDGWQWVVIGFLLFRFFDILKPWPINLADKKLHGGLGIMLDDVIAGVYAAMSLQAVVYLL